MPRSSTKSCEIAQTQSYKLNTVGVSLTPSTWPTTTLTPLLRPITPVAFWQAELSTLEYGHNCIQEGKGQSKCRELTAFIRQYSVHHYRGFCLVAHNSAPLHMPPPTDCRSDCAASRQLPISFTVRVPNQRQSTVTYIVMKTKYTGLTQCVLQASTYLVLQCPLLVDQGDQQLACNTSKTQLSVRIRTKLSLLQLPRQRLWRMGAPHMHHTAPTRVYMG